MHLYIYIYIYIYNTKAITIENLNQLQAVSILGDQTTEHQATHSSMHVCTVVASNNKL